MLDAQYVVTGRSVHSGVVAYSFSEKLCCVFFTFKVKVHLIIQPMMFHQQGKRFYF